MNRSRGKYNTHGRGTGTPRTHGMAHTRTYRAWVEMRRRCQQPKRKEYSNYGARGITISERWLKFENFLEDMGVCPAGLQLDRIDTNGNYETGNCRWATVIEQQNNRRSNLQLTLNGITRTVSDWARIYGVRPRTAAQRIRAGWDAALAVSRYSDKGARGRC